MLKNLFSGNSGGGRGNEFLGQNIDLGQHNLRIKRVLGEGGYGFVFAAQDTSTGKEYALKRLIASDQSSKDDIMQEINFLKQLKGHPNIVRFVAAASSGNEKISHGMTEFLILTELCSGGLTNLLQERASCPFPFEDIVKIFAQTCKAVSHMHKQTPAIIHRDLKIENLLTSDQGMIKLCDFGSSTSKCLYPDSSWTALQRGLAEDEIQKHTTPMYRAPEMIDLYSNHPVTAKADVWSLGCVLYLLCYMKHPFEDAAKLKILNANYSIPENENNISDLQPLIDTMLQVDPEKRPTVDDILYELDAVAMAKNIDLKKPIASVFSVASDQQGTVASRAMISSGSALGGSAILGNVIKGAGLLFNNIKDVSSKVVQSVAGYVRNDLDISYITGRLLVMSFPADGIESAYKNSIDDVRLYLDAKFPEHYVVINISQRIYNVNKLNDRVFESGWHPKKSPPLNQLVSLCRKINNFLRQDKQNVVAIHCLDGKVASAVLVSAFLIFSKLFKKPCMALDMFSLRRLPPGQSCELSASQKRYLGYVGHLVWEPRTTPHKQPLFLKTVVVSPLPLFNKARTGCRPFIEVYENDVRLLSTAQEIDQMREYVLPENKIEFTVNAKLTGDVTIAVYHGRSTLGGKVQGKVTSVNIFTLQLHTGFIDPAETVVVFRRSELDTVDADEQKLPPTFSVALCLARADKSSPESIYCEPWDKMNVEKLSPSVCFASKEEYWKCQDEFGHNDADLPDRTTLQPEQESASQDQKTVGRSTFFDQLQWNANHENEQGDNASTDASMQQQGTGNGFQSKVDASQDRSDTVGLPDKTASDPCVDKYREPMQLIDIGSSDSVLHQANPTAGFQTLKNGDECQRSVSDGNLFNDDFNALSFDSNTKSDQDPYSTSKSGVGVLLDFETSDVPHVEKHFPKSPSTPDLPFDKESEDKQNLMRNRSPSLKKNKSTSDLLDKHADEDFFQELADRHTSEIMEHEEINNAFSLRSNTFVDPFALQSTDNGNSKSPFDAVASMTIKHSSSDGDLLGDWGQTGLLASSLKPNSVRGPPRSHSASSSDLRNPKAIPDDPFAEFAVFLNGDATQKASASNMPAAAQSAAWQAPSQLPTGAFPVQPQANPLSPQAMPPQRHSPVQSTQPNYRISATPAGSSVFGGKQVGQGGLGGSWGQRPAGRDEFRDILGAQGFKASNELQKETLSQLKKLDMKDECDPVKQKIRDWADGKKRNIRALLCSLHTVLWEEEDKWKPCGMHQLIQPAEIKKFYRRACLSVHPDKLTGTPNEHLARAIFIELNEAWTLFEALDSEALF